MAPGGRRRSTGGRSSSSSSAPRLLARRPAPAAGWSPISQASRAPSRSTSRQGWVITRYVEVDESNGVRLFYYFVRSERRPADDPLLLWLTGGPGCSVISALAYEIGPLSFDRNGDVDGLPKLLYNQDSWTKVSNVIFLDSPVGAGFSYSETEQGYKSSDTKAVDQILIFPRKWFDEHQEFLSNPLYIACVWYDRANCHL